MDLTYNNSERLGNHQDQGTVVLDLLATAENGDHFVVEVQTSHHQHFMKRMLYYGGRLIADQGPRGSRKEWGYDIAGAYLIVLMDGFRLPPGPPGARPLIDIEKDATKKRYIHHVNLCERNTGQLFYDEFELIFVELTNFEKQGAELDNDMEGWLYLLKNMNQLKDVPAYFQKPVYEKLFNIAEYSKLKKEEREMYDVSLKRKWDAEMVRRSIAREKAEARRDGLEEGHQEGLELGREEGLELGRQAGRQEERAIAENRIKMVQEKVEAEKLEAARKLQAVGVPLSDIVDALNLPPEQLEKIK